MSWKIARRRGTARHWLSASCRFAVYWLACLLGTTAVSADAPADQYEVTADTVKDRKTGLTWQRNVEPTSRTWAAAKAYCEGLSPGGWRLPRLKELLTLVDTTRSNPAIDVNAFPNTVSERYWSATPYAGTTGSAWTVIFAVGYSSYQNAEDPYFVRCVR
jgi:hypothetical protein